MAQRNRKQKFKMAEKLGNKENNEAKCLLSEEGITHRQKSDSFCGNTQYEFDIAITFNNLCCNISKLLISLSTGTILLSISFQKDLLIHIASSKELLIVGWAVEILSMILGTAFLLSFLWFYHVWVIIWNKPENERKYFKLSFVFGVLQYITFLLGIILIVISIALNLK